MATTIRVNSMSQQQQRALLTEALARLADVANAAMAVSNALSVSTTTEASKSVPVVNTGKVWVKHQETDEQKERRVALDTISHWQREKKKAEARAAKLGEAIARSSAARPSVTVLPAPIRVIPTPPTPLTTPLVVPQVAAEKTHWDANTIPSSALPRDFVVALHPTTAPLPGVLSEPRNGPIAAQSKDEALHGSRDTPKRVRMFGCDCKPPGPYCDVCRCTSDGCTKRRKGCGHCHCSTCRKRKNRRSQHEHAADDEPPAKRARIESAIPFAMAVENVPIVAPHPPVRSAVGITGHHGASNARVYDVLWSDGHITHENVRALVDAGRRGDHAYEAFLAYLAKNPQISRDCLGRLGVPHPMRVVSRVEAAIKDM